MIEINLLPWRETKRNISARKFIIGLIASVIIACLFMLISYKITTYQIFRQERRTLELDSEIQRYYVRLQIQESSISLRDEFLEKFKFLLDLDQQWINMVSLLNQLVEIISDNVFYSQLAFKDGTLEITGVAKNSVDLTRLIQNITDQNLALDSKLIEIKKTQMDQFIMTSFKLKLALN